MTAPADPMPAASPRGSRPALHLPTLGAIAAELAVCATTLTLALTHWSAPAAALAFIVIATRQHALFILYHDAVHNNVARSRRLNDLLTNALIGLPQLVPVQLYRRLHLAHHARLGTDADPERLLLYRDQPWDYRPLPLRRLLAQLAGDLLLLNNLRTLRHFGRELADPRSKLQLPEAKIPAETWALAALYLAAFALWLALDPDLALRFALLWFVPLLTLTQAIQKVRSFAEHAPMDAPELSYSWRVGWIGRLILWPYHINYHREHHVHPRIPWYDLPRAFPEVSQRPSRALWRLLWDGRW